MADEATGNGQALDILHCNTLIKSEILYEEPGLDQMALNTGRLTKARYYFYDSFGRPVQIVEVNSDESSSRYSYKYDFCNNVLVASEKHILPDGHEDNLVLRYTYDMRGRKTQCERTEDWLIQEEELNSVFVSYDDFKKIECEDLIRFSLRGECAAVALVDDGNFYCVLYNNRVKYLLLYVPDRELFYYVKINI